MQRIVSLVAAAALAASACATDDEDVGGVQLDLTGSSPSGHVYRLRNAELTVSGSAGTIVLRTEDDPRRERIDFRVRAGAYQLTVAPGWFLERVAADGSAGRVPAVLETEMPHPFVIQPDRFTPITLRFRVNGDPVDFGDGTGGIDLDIDDSPDAGAPDAQVPAPDAQPAPPQILVTPPTVSIEEGTTGRFFVSLSSPPFETLTVAVTSPSPSVVVSPSVITFTPLDWQILHPVAVSALRDPDSNDETAIVSLAAPGVPPARVVVNVIDVDVDAPQIVVSPASLALTEGGSAVLRVHLSARPAGNVLVTAAAASSQIAVSPAALTFTPANFSVDQAITVTAPQDPDTANASTAIQLVGAGMPGVAVPVTVTDDDVQRIIVEPATLVVREGARAALTVRLAAPPFETLTVAVTSQSPLLSVAPATVTFNPVNWNLPQQVVVAAAQDPDRLDSQGLVTLSAPGLPPVRVAVNIADDDI